MSSYTISFVAATPSNNAITPDSYADITITMASSAQALTGEWNSNTNE